MIFIVRVLVVDIIVTECDIHILTSMSLTSFHLLHLCHFVQMQVYLKSILCSGELINLLVKLIHISASAHTAQVPRMIDYDYIM